MLTGYSLISECSMNQEWRYEDFISSMKFYPSAEPLLKKEDIMISKENRQIHKGR